MLTGSSAIRGPLTHQRSTLIPVLVQPSIVGTDDLSLVTRLGTPVIRGSSDHFRQLVSDGLSVFPSTHTRGSLMFLHR